MIENRRFLRIPFSVPLKFRKVDFMQEESSLSKDLSVKGIRFLSHRFVAVNTHIKIELKTREDSLVKFIARTVWVRSLYADELYEVGAQICEISQEGASYLCGFFGRRP